ncbi:MAG TPA: cyclopropane-fatty-acyl-phospholipid synthase family protein, partial [Tahibacter sp.]|nr:cyclopropane-fatty-acyl-phospholipid synthase family protein [Tahibacter sp.]
MNDTSKVAAVRLDTRVGALDRALRERLLRLLATLNESRLTLIDALGASELGDGNGDDPLHARVRVHDAAFWRRVATHGSVGAGEAYIDGQWDCDDLVALVRMLVRNRDHLDAMDTGLARLGGVALRAWAALRRNTHAGSRRNIAAHYDLGNAFFGLFLSDDLMYSSALFARDDESLETASTRKLERICAKLDLGPNDRVLEIGSGWGGFALHAASRYGCHVTTTTISREQYELATARVAAAGLADRVTVLDRDYRDLDGRYDKLVSIEMVEAIGHEYLDTYCRTLAARLEPHGLALVQAITIEDHRYGKALAAVDFIKRHVFPGSFIPSVAAILDATARTGDLRLVNLEDIGTSYALTLKAWRERFLARLPEVRAQGFDERFVRLWEFYLAYCEGGFRERSIGTVQMLLARPRNRRATYL